MRVHMALNLRTDEVIYSNKFSNEAATHAWIAAQSEPKDWIHFTIEPVEAHWRTVKASMDYLSNNAKMVAAESVVPQKQVISPAEIAAKEAISTAHSGLQLAQADLERASNANKAQLMIQELADIGMRRARYQEVRAHLNTQIGATETPSGALTSSLRNVEDSLKGLDQREAYLKLELSQLIPATEPPTTTNDPEASKEPQTAGAPTGADAVRARLAAQRQQDKE